MSQLIGNDAADDIPDIKLERKYPEKISQIVEGSEGYEREHRDLIVGLKDIIGGYSDRLEEIGISVSMAQLTDKKNLVKIKMR